MLSSLGESSSSRFYEWSMFLTRSLAHSLAHLMRLVRYVLSKHCTRCVETVLAAVSQSNCSETP